MNGQAYVSFLFCLYDVSIRFCSCSDSAVFFFFLIILFLQCYVIVIKKMYEMHKTNKVQQIIDHLNIPDLILKLYFFLEELFPLSWANRKEQII